MIAKQKGILAIMGTKSFCTKGSVLLLLLSTLTIVFSKACMAFYAVVNFVEFAGISYTAQSCTDL